jgi:AraC-like DNA-binding protein
MPTRRSVPPSRRSTETVLARVITHMLAHAEKEGLNRDALLQAAGLESLDLTHPDARVPLSAQVALWQLIAKATSDPGYGIRSGATFRVRNAGLLGYAMYYSATLGAALRRLVRYSRIVIDIMRPDLETLDQQHVAITMSHPALGAGLPFAEDTELATIVGICREVTGVDLAPFEVVFTHDPPASTAEHRRFFRCPLRFGGPVSKLVLLQRDLALPIARGDETLAGYLDDDAEVVLRTLVSGSSVRERARSAIWALLSEGRPTLPQIASALQLPPRTLQRHLAREGTSLHAEIEHIRKAMATAALRNQARPIEEIAFVLGYAEPSTFYRSFKRWTGKTPQQYRTAST